MVMIIDVPMAPCSSPARTCEWINELEHAWEDEDADRFDHGDCKLSGDARGWLNERDEESFPRLAQRESD